MPEPVVRPAPEPVVRPCGAAAWLVEVAEGAVDETFARLRQAADDDVELLPAAATVLVRSLRGAPGAELRGWIQRALAAEGPSMAQRVGRDVVIPVLYDGPDLGAMAQRLGWSKEAVVAAHAGATYPAAFGGFAPGFVYLRGLPDALQTPRLSTPRARVEAGSVAVADVWTAVYPTASPGGWNLLGRTAAPLWDVRRDPPTLVTPGDRVRFSPVRELATVTRAVVVPPTEVSAAGPLVVVPPTEVSAAGSLVVVASGPLATVQDRGRRGWAAVGVGCAGPADVVSHDRANRLVGNAPDAATIETTLGGLQLEARGDAWVAITGAPCTVTLVRKDGSRVPVAMEVALAVREGERLVMGTPTVGVRSYLAVRGGVASPPVLGSRATDTLGGVGGPPLRAGATLPVGTSGRPGWPATPFTEVAAVRPAWAASVPAVRITPGPRFDWLADPAELTSAPWEVSAESNRVGVRLCGEPMTRREGEVASEAMVLGAVQVPPSGLPVVFGVDHPVTGGYPVVAVVLPDDMPTVGQLRPGTSVQLRWATP